MEVKWMMLLLSTHWCYSTEFYSSTDHMTQLIDIQREFAQCLSEYTEALQRLTDILKRAVNALECTSEDTETFISNPLAAYRLVRKLNKVWTITREVLEEENVQDSLKKVRSAAQMLPGPDDVEGLVMALLRLQDIYRLHPTNISGFSEVKHNITLDADETFDIAVMSYQNQRLGSALVWMLETLRKLNAGEKATVSREDLLYHLALFSCHLSAVKDLMNVRDRPACSAHMIETMKTWDWTEVSAHFATALEHTSHEENTYESLCTGRRLKSRTERGLVCRYRRGRLGIYAPFKEEVEWTQPLILRYHDFTSEREMNIIKTLARPKLSRAKVSDPVSGKKFSAEVRVSKSAWLSEDDDPLITRINQRITDVTGLDLETAEELQVANYGIGGQYEPHYDSKLANDSDFQLRGGRIATLLIYVRISSSSV
ncbi:putative prolyl 4-hydroxylase subunit alpha-2-like [Triplophysa rosa]|uniref:Prolyl 4-hydroxylase subunit alpha-2-like n=1 Tax=Triplophysa rosa TaxID=992332 RepID=A0A9W7WE73_TRIRA|nr:putative prolyl 4-hydroxylase subunit alpha-2-like [Triplophysa rosa]